MGPPPHISLYDGSRDISVSFFFRVRFHMCVMFSCLCPSFPNVRSGRAALHGCRASFLDLSLSTCTFTKTFRCAREQSGLVSGFGSSVNFVNVDLGNPFADASGVPRPLAQIWQASSSSRWAKKDYDLMYGSV